MSSPFNVIIIGAGNIGAFFDRPENDSVFTHAHAFKNHQGFNLLGFIDSDYSKALKAANVWNTSAYSNLKEAFEKNVIDVVVICTPDEFHYKGILEAITFPIKLVFVEKPLAKKNDDANDVLNKTKKIPVAVNYSRRFSKDLQILRSRVQNNDFGSYITGNGYYGKGILHNGTHMIDLLRMLIGEISDVCSYGKIYDFYKDDPAVSGVLTFENGKPFNIHGIDSRLYTIFELDMLFEKARIRLLDSCFAIEEYTVKPNEKFAGYFSLNLKNCCKTDLHKSMSNAVENIYNFLTTEEPLKCTVQDAYNDLCIALKML